MPRINIGHKLPRADGEPERAPLVREYRDFIRPMAIAPETRAKKFDGDYNVSGVAATFDTQYVIWVGYDGVEYYEKIDRHALDGADMSDIIMQYNHGGSVLARTGNDTLAVEVEDAGLMAYADLSKSNAAKNLYEEIKNGLVTKMSWAFSVTDTAYDRKTRTLTILKVDKVYDVSAVAYPANPDTEISARESRSISAGVIARLRRESLKQAISLEKIHLMLKMSKLMGKTQGEIKG